MRARLLLALILLLVSQARPSNADMGDTTASYNATPPVFGSGGDTTVPAGVEARSVFGSIVIGSTALSAGNVTISICGGAVLENLQTAPIASLGLTWAYSFVVTGGSCYRFNNNADPTGSNKIASYNYVDVANESFEGRAHANETAPQWGAPPTGLRIHYLQRESGQVVFRWDANTTPANDTVYANLTGIHTGTGFEFAPSMARPEYESRGVVSNVWQRTGDCVGFIDVFYRDMVTMAESRHARTPYDCDLAQDASDVATADTTTATSNATMVHIEWTSQNMTTNEDDRSAWEIAGNSSTTLPAPFGGYNNWTFPVDYYAPSSSRSLDVPLSDFPPGHTFLRILYYPDIDGTSFGCEVDFVADDEPHSCGTMAAAVAGGNITYSNTTVNVTASGESFLPVVFGPSNDNAGMGDSLSVGPSPRLAATGTSLIVNGCFYPIINPFPDAAGATQGTMPCDGFAEDDVFTMTRNGTFLSADVRAIGPYQDAGDDTGIPSTENISLLVEVQKNNVTLGSATWAAGEVATKTIALAGGEFVEGDDFRIVLTPSATAPGNATYFNIVEATYGILWGGNATGAGSLVVTSTIDVKTAADPWIPLVLFGVLALYCLYSRAPYYMTAFAFVGMLAGAMYRHDPSAVPSWVIDTPVVLVVLAIVWRLVTRPRTAIMEGHA